MNTYIVVASALSDACAEDYTTEALLAMDEDERDEHGFIVRYASTLREARALAVEVAAEWIVSRLDDNLPRERSYAAHAPLWLADCARLGAGRVLRDVETQNTTIGIRRVEVPAAVPA